MMACVCVLCVTSLLQAQQAQMRIKLKEEKVYELVPTNLK